MLDPTLNRGFIDARSTIGAKHRERCLVRCIRQNLATKSPDTTADSEPCRFCLASPISHLNAGKLNVAKRCYNTNEPMRCVRPDNPAELNAQPFGTDVDHRAFGVAVPIEPAVRQERNGESPVLRYRMPRMPAPFGRERH
jgi:hypothetical protein